MAVVAATVAGVGALTHRVALILWAAAVLAFGILGGLDDLRSLGAGRRALAQLVLSAATVGCLAAFFTPPWWLATGAVVAVVAFVNAANFMDGLNGLSGMFGVVAGLAYAGLGLVADLSWLVVAGACVAAAFLAFLPWNAVNPRLFLGDVGSYALGAAVAGAGVGAAFASAPVPAVVAPVLVYVADTGYTLVRRIRAGERWYEAHRSHVYQRLNQAGWSHLSVAILVAAASALCGASGLLWAVGDAGLQTIAAAVCVVTVAMYVSSPRIAKAWGMAKGQVVSVPQVRRR
jgi:UDP-N-acetylmuramyl pentapeptide phosphotransferase/UDP-N-acetylglucosamine-1-phosphate transferase